MGFGAGTTFTDAVLLRAVDYRDSDRILTFLTQEYGKIAVLARGARRSKKRFSGALEPCSITRVEVSLGRGELGQLTQATIARGFPTLLGDLRRITLATAALELVREFAPSHEPVPLIFEAAVALLSALDSVPEAEESHLWAFQARLLAVAGLAPRLDHCGRCGKHAPEGKAARFDPNAGSIVCGACGGGPILLSGSTRNRLRQCMASGWSEAALGWSGADTAQARRTMEALAEHHLGRAMAGPRIIQLVEESRLP